MARVNRQKHRDGQRTLIQAVIDSSYREADRYKEQLDRCPARRELDTSTTGAATVVKTQQQAPENGIKDQDEDDDDSDEDWEFDETDEECSGDDNDDCGPWPPGCEVYDPCFSVECGPHAFCRGGSCVCSGNFIGNRCDTECDCSGHGTQTDIAGARAVGAWTARTGVLSLLQLLHNLHHLRRGWGRSHVAALRRKLEQRAVPCHARS